MKAVLNNQEDNKESDVGQNDATNQAADKDDKKEIVKESSGKIESNDIEVQNNLILSKERRYQVAIK